MSYNHLSPYDRGRIQALHEEGKTVTAIALALGRHRTTIRRELTRPGGGRGYQAERAQQHYHERRKVCRPGRKLDHRSLWDWVFSEDSQGAYARTGGQALAFGVS